MPVFSRNSKKTLTRCFALATEFDPSSQGMSAVPGPNGSDSGLRMTCQ
jgi:hypothetical protein